MYYAVFYYIALCNIGRYAIALCSMMQFFYALHDNA